MPAKNEIFFNKYKMIADLEIEIKVARAKLEKIWNERGYTDDDVLNASIKVDNLLNKYHQLKDDTIYKPYVP
jgi:cupin superfamily acireductone dioxygenase involved in methionine salvage